METKQHLGPSLALFVWHYNMRYDMRWVFDQSSSRSENPLHAMYTLCTRFICVVFGLLLLLLLLLRRCYCSAYLEPSTWASEHPLHKPRESKLSNIGLVCVCVRAHSESVENDRLMRFTFIYCTCTRYTATVSYTMRCTLCSYACAHTHTKARARARAFLRDYLCVCVAINV